MKSRASGFTLIEVLIAIVILALISMLVWQASATLTNAKLRFEEEDTVFHEVALALNRMADELATSFIINAQDFDLLGMTPSGEASTQTVFLGKNNGDQDSLLFDAFSNVRYLRDIKQSDQAAIEYKLTPDPESDGDFELRQRSQSPLTATPTEGGVEYTVLSGVKELNFRYYDGKKEEWVDEWNTEGVDHANRLPLAVEITLAIRDPIFEEEKLSFTTVALLEMAPGPLSFQATTGSAGAATATTTTTTTTAPQGGAPPP